MQTPQQNNILLELHVPDFRPIKDYYEKLGFTAKWVRKPEGFKGYMILAMGQNILCFWAGNEHVYEQEYFSQFPKTSPRGYGVEIVIMVDDIKAYYDQIKDFANVV